MKRSAWASCWSNTITGSFEEPVPFDWYEETKQVADALKIPIAGGEQEYSLHGFRWLIANDGLQIVQPDNYYFGGMIRSMKVARMAQAFGKQLHAAHVGRRTRIPLHDALRFGPAECDGPSRVQRADDPGQFECKTSPLQVENGEIKVPTGPGLGVDIDHEFIQKHEIVKA